MSVQLKGCILDFASLAASDLNLSALKALPIDWTFYDSTQAAETAERIAVADIVLTNKVVLDKTLLEANNHIKLVIILATGTNNVDLAAAKALSIPVSNIVAYSTESVVQQTFAMMLNLRTHQIEYDAAVKRGDWCNSQFFGLLDYPISEVFGKTLGIIGYGAIGRRVKQVAEAFGMKVLVAKSLSGKTSVNEGFDRVDLAGLYQEADVISIHSPLTPESTNLVTMAAFKQMKNTAIVLNMGRGGIVNEQDLATALKRGEIQAAAVDVLSQEPPAKDHPLLDSGIPNLLLAPHTAWASVEARQELLDQVVKILQSLLSLDAYGRVVNQVN
jgi:glycerate dehydrogenase